MRSRTALRVLAGIGILALSATAAQAGGGGSSPSPLTSFFVCQATSKGAASGKVVDVDSSFFSGTPGNPNSFFEANPQGITIGSGILACVFAKLFPSDGSAHVACSVPPDPPVPGCNEIDPNPTKGPGQNQQLKCYSFSVSNKPLSGPPALWNVTDTLLAPPGSLTGMDLAIQVKQLAFICAPATFVPAP